MTSSVGRRTEYEMSELLEIYEPEMEGLVDADASLVELADGFVFTEGPVWDFEREHLLFVDLAGNALYRYREGEGVTSYRKPSDFSNGTAIDAEGRLVVCEHRTRRVAREVEPGRFLTVVDAFGGERLNAPNDVIVTPDGSIVFTDPHYGLTEGYGGPGEQLLPHRGVYRVPPGADEPELLVDDFDGPNGLALDPTGQRLYVDDTERGHIRVFDVHDDWTLSGGSVFAELRGDGDGVLDGLKLDESGRVYCTGPGGIWVCEPHGAIIGRIRIPVVAANLAWGDQDAQTLYITASEHLYRLRTKVRGFAPHRDAYGRRTER
jgi:gluconolactonase